MTNYQVRVEPSAALRWALRRCQGEVSAWLDSRGAGNADALCDAAIQLCGAALAVLCPEDSEQGVVHAESAQIIAFPNQQKERTT